MASVERFSVGPSGFDPESDAVTADRLHPISMSAVAVDSLYREVGYLLDSFPKPAVLADALVPDCPVVGVSDSFVALSGYTREEVLGKNCRILLKDVPGYCISRSGRKNLRSMIRMCRLIGISSMGNTCCCQTNSTAAGETFVNMFAVGLILLGEHPLLVGVHSALSEGVCKSDKLQVELEHYAMIEQIRAMIHRKVDEPSKIAVLDKEHFLPPRRRSIVGAEAFFSGALTERVILLNDRRTVMRREPWEIPNGCVVISETPLRRTRQGMFFAIRLEGVLAEGGWGASWPVVGMTSLSPDDMTKQGYPVRAEWCGKSVCVGGEFQATVRDKPTHHKARFSKPKPEDLTAFDGPRPRWQGRSTTPWEIGEGDVLGVLYTPQGFVHLMLNYQTVLSVDTGCPLQDNTDYYALVDVSGRTYEITRLPYDLPVTACIQELGLQPQISRSFVDYAAREAASRAVASCSFSVTVADPSQPDMPLVAVSPGFEHMTGFACEEIVGLNCRFLSNGCEAGSEQRSRIRESCRTGRPYACLLENRRKNGETFLNMLDLCGLRVAKDLETEEDVWYLIGIQSDVSELIDDNGSVSSLPQIRKEHAKELEEVAKHLREELKTELARLSIASQPVLEVGELGGTVPVPAAQGIQEGPKPDLLPKMVFLTEPTWITATDAENNYDLAFTLGLAKDSKYIKSKSDDALDDNSEPEQVDKTMSSSKLSSKELNPACCTTLEKSTWFQAGTKSLTLSLLSPKFGTMGTGTVLAISMACAFVASSLFASQRLPWMHIVKR